MLRHMSNATRKVTTSSPVTLDEIRPASDFQKANTLTAQLRQEVTTVSYYPSKKVSNELNGSLFTASECGFEEQSFSNTENRVAFIAVPELATAEMINAKLVAANKAGCCIYRVLSNQPILSEDQKWSIRQGYRTMDDYADSQVMRYGEGHKNEGDLIKVNGHIVYRKTFFSEGPKADMDLRSGEVYLSAAIREELHGDFQLNGDMANEFNDAQDNSEQNPFATGNPAIDDPAIDDLPF